MKAFSKFIFGKFIKKFAGINNYCEPADMDILAFKRKIISKSLATLIKRERWTEPHAFTLSKSFFERLNVLRNFSKCWVIKFFRPDTDDFSIWVNFIYTDGFRKGSNEMIGHSGICLIINIPTLPKLPNGCFGRHSTS